MFPLEIVAARPSADLGLLILVDWRNHAESLMKAHPEASVPFFVQTENATDEEA